MTLLPSSKWHDNGGNTAVHCPNFKIHISFSLFHSSTHAGVWFFLKKDQIKHMVLHPESVCVPMPCAME